MLLAGAAALSLAVPAAAQAAVGAAGCAALAQPGASLPDPGGRIAGAVWHGAGPVAMASPPPGTPPAPPLALPAHCEVTGVLHERIGIDGQHYAIRFHLRMPTEWNGKFFMQGGGGTNGELGDAIGRLSGGAAPALVQGYAVMSQDSGHDNAVNSVAARGGASSFGFDPQARADYGGASLRPSVEAAKATVKAFYGKRPGTSYFVGCSKGGQEGMMLAQRYPDLFDGIVAAAPGFALPRAAIEEAWDTQAFAQVVTASGQPVTLSTLGQSLSAADSALVGKAILAACDKDDGAVDGMVGDFTRCTSAKVLPELARITCGGVKQDGCLSAAQVAALQKVQAGARNRRGEPLYASYYWDAGWADPGWRIWKVGNAPVPSINVLMGSPSLGAVFTTPPTAIDDDPQAKLAYQIGFDFDRDAAKIYATDARFARSAWQDIAARSDDLAAFNRRGGKLIVPHGVSDPVFSLADTVAWYGDVDKRNGGRAASFVRLFPVPGMAHCQGGPATDGFDSFAALVNWVERARAPDQMVGTAGPMSPWPGRTRPLCAYPKVARYKGAGSLEDADSFVCS
ncbi:tannase/feruloyl esterase family alpha/beta hydrolase [Sphingomonas sp. MMS24-J13]|uniref:tannase/feruloyl esterase family alpha/beta hydrolase n=1 Tax=Sphingomonas sp. MMS24-J13 TaxID=3238686 RepID=UPI0038515DBE